MRKMSHNEIRNMWISYFKSKNHKVEESASLVPVNDDSLLWINAGVAPLKKYFDGSEIPESKRITNIQKCIRTNDIENVGVTKRHLTFFEMMGNFSIGDYFKEEAIEFAFELLTSPQYFSIPLEKLYVTVYTDDEEAYEKWISLGMSEDHIIRLSENFWEIGEGPCGPDSEIFFDRGEKYDPNGDALEKFKNDEEQERYIEIWNNVFSQFNSKKNTPREKYKELPHKNIDTGAGLERWCIIFQDAETPFETDLLQPIIERLEKMTGILYEGQTAFKVIADHIKAITFALSDGAVFENVGRGYVLRRLLRRSVRYGKKLGLSEPFLYLLVSDVVSTMEEAYPYLNNNRGVVETLVLEEEKLFMNTLESGERRLQEVMEVSPDKTISGEDAFKLYDTFGFPFELTEEYLREHGFTVSRDEFDQYMNLQRELAKKNAKTKSSMASDKQVFLDFTKESTFVYGLYRVKSNVIGIFSRDKMEKSLDHDGFIALKRTCFYAESGGQVSDTGMIVGKNFKARVLDVFKAPNGQHIHQIKLLDGVIELKDDCEIVVDKERRRAIEANHSSVHLLHHALRSTLGDGVHQAGSYVDDEKLRLDFTYASKLTDEKVLEAERMVNDFIAKQYIVSTEIMPIDKAKQLGAIALFTEKYGDMVRVVKMGKSVELCGGTHASNTKDIQQFAIFSYESKGSNTYRIEATTGKKIEKVLFDTIKPYNDEMIKLLMKAREILDEAHKCGIVLDFDVTIDNSKPTSYQDIIFNCNELSYIQSEVRDLEKKYQEEKAKLALEELDLYRQDITSSKKVSYLVKQTQNIDNHILKTIADQLVSELDAGVIFFANVKEDHSVNYLCRSNTDLVSAGLLMKKVVSASNGNGGGSPTFAQGGSRESGNLDSVFASIKEELSRV